MSPDLDALAAQLRRIAGNSAEMTVAGQAAAAIEALIAALRTTDDYRIADWQKLEAERDEAERERDELAAVIESLRGLVEADAHYPIMEREDVRSILLTAPSEALAEHDRTVAAKALRDAAERHSDWEVFRASDGHSSIRQHGLPPDVWLRTEADRIEQDTNHNEQEQR